MITNKNIETYDGYTDFVEGKIITDPSDRLMENLLGLCEEVGELLGKVKRMLRDKEFNREDILNECGDVYFYNTSIASYFGSSLTEVININMDKLNDREARGVLKGSGDER